MRKLAKFVVLTVVLSIALVVFAQPAFASYASSVNSFINDSRWANGIWWDGNQQPKMPGNNQYWGCAAYACDFARYVWGASSYHDGYLFYDFNEIRDGDIIHTGGHYYVVLQRIGNTLWTAEGNVKFGKNENTRYLTWITTDHFNAGSSAGCGGFVQGWHNPNYEPYSGKASLDVNGCLDGQESGGLQDYGTFDVYINGSCVANDVNDYFVEWPLYTSYSIRDIKPSNGHNYDGVHSGSLEGAIGPFGSSVRLNFSSYDTLDVQGMLDGVLTDNTSGFGTFDVYINGVLDASGVSDYKKQWPRGTSYKIKNVQAAEGKYFSSSDSDILSSTLDKGVNLVLSFSTIKEVGQDWTTADKLPGYIDPATVEIQYNNRYEKTAETSPGAGWTQVAGSDVISYVNVGDVYETNFEQATSDTCVHVGTYYYHYCGYSMSDANYEYTSAYNTYHNVGDINQYYVTGQWSDYADSRYQCYQINWVSGQWAGGGATCSSGKTNVYYRRYQYQNRRAVTNYQWVSESGWTSEKDASATSTTVRYRLKQYDVNFDANGGTNAPEKQVKFHGVDLQLTKLKPQRPAYNFTGWNTQADGKGKSYAAGSIYADNAAITLFAQWKPASGIILPANLTAIEERAFEGVAAAIIEIPDGCLRIGTEAFLNCRNLTQLYIPASVKTIAFDAFDGCDKLTIYAPADSAAIKLARTLGIAYEITA